MQTNRITNLEHFEAEQEDANKQREREIASFSPEEQEKFKAVEKAVKILEEAKIRFHLFPELANPIPEKFDTDTVVWQWNSTVSTGIYDSSGKPTEESNQKLQEYYCKLCWSIWYWLGMQQGLDFTNFVRVFHKKVCEFHDLYQKEE